MRILNLEQGRPDRLTARRLLLSGLENARPPVTGRSS